jgi:hypothetical protein
MTGTFFFFFCFFFLFFFLKLPFPFFAIRLLRYLSVGRFSNSCSLFFLPIGDATGLRGAFPGHPRPFHLTFTDIMTGTFWVLNLKTRNYFVVFYYLYRTFTSGYLCCMTALILFTHVGFLEYLSFKQFKFLGRITICMSK